MKTFMKIQFFFKNHPFLFALFALIASRGAGLGTIAIIQLLRPELSIQENLGWLLMAIYAAVVVSLVYWTDTADEVGLRRAASLKEWLLLVPFLALPLLILLEDGVQSWGFSTNLVLFIAAVGVAVNEEVLFRGILLRGFIRWESWIAILVPSSLFALAHATNAFAGGNTVFALYQTIWTFAAGIAFSAIRLRNQSLYPIILLHILVDGVEYFSSGEYGIHSQVISLALLQLFTALNVALAIYSLALLYRNNKRALHNAKNINYSTFEQNK